jgi:hypothetical protein
MRRTNGAKIDIGSMLAECTPHAGWSRIRKTKRWILDGHCQSCVFKRGSSRISVQDALAGARLSANPSFRGSAIRNPPTPRNVARDREIYSPLPRGLSPRSEPALSGTCATGRSARLPRPPTREPTLDSSALQPLGQGTEGSAAGPRNDIRALHLQPDRRRTRILEHPLRKAPPKPSSSRQGPGRGPFHVTRWR